MILMIRVIGQNDKSTKNDYGIYPKNQYFHFRYFK